jgi:hypothetical protein
LISKGVTFFLILIMESLAEPAQVIGGGFVASAYALNEKEKRRTERNE